MFLLSFKCLFLNYIHEKVLSIEQVLIELNTLSPNVGMVTVALKWYKTSDEHHCLLIEMWYPQLSFHHKKKNKGKSTKEKEKNEVNVKVQQINEINEKCLNAKWFKSARQIDFIVVAQRQTFSNLKVSSSSRKSEQWRVWTMKKWFFFRKTDCDVDKHWKLNEICLKCELVCG